LILGYSWILDFGVQFLFFNNNFCKEIHLSIFVMISLWIKNDRIANKSSNLNAGYL
jgi:hypothetical protein